MCDKKLDHIGQGESVYNAFAREGTEWMIKGVRSLRKKSEGPGEMVSGLQDERRGYGLPLSADELAEVNAKRLLLGRPALKATPGLRFLLPLKNRKGYWGFAEFEEQVIDAMDCLEVIEPGKKRDRSLRRAREVHAGWAARSKHEREIRRKAERGS